MTMIFFRARYIILILFSFLKNVSKTDFEVCLKDIQRFDAPHDPITVNYMAVGCKYEVWTVIRLTSPVLSISRLDYKPLFREMSPHSPEGAAEIELRVLYESLVSHELNAILFHADYNPCINVSCPYYGVCNPVNGTRYSCICVPCATNESEPLCDNKDKTHQSICTYKYKVCTGKEEPGIKHYGGCKRKFLLLFWEFWKDCYSCSQR